MDGVINETAAAVIASITIDNNTIHNGTDGVVMKRVDGQPALNESGLLSFRGISIENNTIFDCLGSPSGIHLNGTTNLSVHRNHIDTCAHGIYLQNSSNCSLTYNWIENNTAASTGAHLDADSHDNEIHYNCFIENVEQAYDDGLRNDWDTNYWSDYTGTPSYYMIPAGSAGTQDSNPLGYCPLRGEPPCGVGGEVLPVNILELLAPYIFIVVSAVALIAGVTFGWYYKKKK
ncbi:MAG: right-handed parallel beta-helix repeat-containing protein [Thermoplasmatota archaeon]